MSIFQLIAVLFAVFMMYVIRVKNARYKITYVESIGWYSIWIVFAFLSIFPEILTGFVHVLKFERVFDLLIVVAFMILTMLVFFSHFKVKELDDKLEKIVRKEALKK